MLLRQLAFGASAQLLALRLLALAKQLSRPVQTSAALLRKKRLVNGAVHKSFCKRLAFGQEQAPCSKRHGGSNPYLFFNKIRFCRVFNTVDF